MTTTTETEAQPGETPDQTPAQELADAAQGAAEDPGEATAQADGDERGDEPESDRRDPAAQAARYRRRLREVEAERDQVATERDLARTAILTDLLARVDVRGTTLHEHAMGETGVLPAWDAITDENGQVDLGAIRDHLDQLHQSRPYLFASPRSHDPIQGRTRGGDAGRGTSWPDVLSGRASRA
ncbi:hypothetical protein [Promicromonospora soli]